MTYEYIENGKKITNIYTGNASRAILDTISKFEPTHQYSQDINGKDFIARPSVNYTNNPYNINNDIYHACFQKRR